MPWTGWTEFRPFTDYFEVKSYVGFAGRNRKWQTSLEGVKGSLSQSEGLFPLPEGPFDYKTLHEDAIPSGVYWIRVMGDRRCKHPSKHFDYIGLAAGQESGTKFQRGIFNRIFDHYRKIVMLPARGKIDKYLAELYPKLAKEQRQQKFIRSKFSDYRDLRAFFVDQATNESLIERDSPEPWVELFHIFEKELATTADINKFFSRQVRFRYNSFSSGTSAAREQQIGKAEGLALQEYFHRYGDYPFLNTRSEVRSLDNFGKTD